MQKIAYILTVGIGFISCSVLKTNENIALSEKEAISAKEIINLNVAEINFSFTRIEILIEDSGTKQKLFGNLRYVNSGKYLLSLRNNAGIEGIRIYIDKDTILANDRINRKTYYGSSSHLHEKYGISIEYLPVLFGDLIIDEEDKNSEIKCNGGVGEIKKLIGLNEIHYIADCSKNKIIKAELNNDSNKYRIEVEYKGFKKVASRLYPLSIIINNLFNSNRIEIKIKKAEIYKGKELNFIQGNNYQLILLQ